TGYAAVGGGKATTAPGEPGAVVQVSPDVMLTVFRVDPQNGILDADPLGALSVRLRFNKSIEGWPDNFARFHVKNAQGSELASQVQITGNDALVTLNPGHGLSVGQKLAVIAQKGIASVKRLSENQTITLYSLAQDQRFELSYRGARPDALALDS